MNNIKHFFSLFFCLNVLCASIQAKNFLRHLDMENLEQYGVKCINNKNDILNRYQINSKSYITFSPFLTKNEDGETGYRYSICLYEGKNFERKSVFIKNDKKNALIYISKDSQFPFNGKEPGLYTCELDLSYNDTIASTLELSKVFTEKKYPSVNYTLSEETCGFMWIEKFMWDKDNNSYSEVYDSSMKKVFSPKKNSVVTFVDLRYYENAHYYGYEGISFNVLYDDYSAELFTVEGKSFFKGEKEQWIFYIASGYEHNYQSIGFYYFDKKDRVVLFDSNGKFVKKIPSEKHKYISEFGYYLPSKSKSFLANKKTDINKLLNRNDIYEGNGLFQYLVNYDEDKIGEYKLKANNYINNRNFKKAATYYGKAFELSKSGNDLFNRGIAYYNAGKYHQAIVDFQNCLTFSDINDDVMTRAPRLIAESKDILAEKAERRERTLNALAYGLSQMSQNGNVGYNITNNSYRSVPRFNYNSARMQIYNNVNYAFNTNSFNKQKSTNQIINYWQKFEDDSMDKMLEAFKIQYDREPTEEEKEMLRAMVQDAIARGIAQYNMNNSSLSSSYSSSSSSSSSSSASSNQSSSDREPLTYLEEIDCTFCAGSGDCKWCKDGWVIDVGKNHECPNCYAPLKGKCHQCQGTGKRKRIAHNH